MKYYLSSYKLGNKTQELKELFFVGKKIALIANARDHIREDKASRDRYVQRRTEELTSLGFQVTFLDLQTYFGKEDQLRNDIINFNGIYVTGGDVFVLRHAMALSGFDKIIKEKTKDPFFVYVAYSAGCCVLAPSLDAYKIVDDPNRNPYNTDPTIWEGLGLYPSAILPHYKSDHPESAMIDQEVAYCIENGVMFETLRDGEVIIID